MTEQATVSVPSATELQGKSISEISRLIRKDWPKVYFGAVPYLEAMRDLHTINDAYGADSGADIVRYFLSNATTWRGPMAKAIKAHLKALVK